MSVSIIFVSDRAAQAKVLGEKLGPQPPCNQLPQEACHLKGTSFEVGLLPQEACHLKGASCEVGLLVQAVCALLQVDQSLIHVSNFIDPGWLAWV